jgi:hypothetical protein
LASHWLTLMSLLHPSSVLVPPTIGKPTTMVVSFLGTARHRNWVCWLHLRARTSRGHSSGDVDCARVAGVVQGVKSFPVDGVFGGGPSRALGGGLCHYPRAHSVACLC